jgi:hypothetical protein
MDVDRVFYQVEAKDNDQAKKLAYMRKVGAAGSAFEHAVPERLFINTTICNAPGMANPDPGKPACPQGVSAVKALAIAAAQGQRIYTLSAQNQVYHSTILAQLTIGADAKAEIENALTAGKQVTTHQADITVNGWTGNGYVILDPETGAGAYKISGGPNGGSTVADMAVWIFGALITAVATAISSNAFAAGLDDATKTVSDFEGCIATLIVALVLIALFVVFILPELIGASIVIGWFVLPFEVIGAALLLSLLAGLGKLADIACQ